LLIVRLTPSPVAGTDDANPLSSEREADGQNSGADSTESEIARFGAAVRRVFGENELRIPKRPGSLQKGDAVLDLVVHRFLRVPFEDHPRIVVDGA
jgi:hypothetical protein